MRPNIAISLSLFALSGGVALYQTHSDKSKADQVAKTFANFAPNVKTHSDEQSFYVESDGMPDHKLMAGITAWQQQVPLPQKYTGNNAWQFPLNPVPAKEPLSAKDHFFRGAIAIAANGVPIFNPIKNDGRTDTFLAGELDDFGGHSGQGDDYHYHIPPLHLQSKIGKGLPVAYALDGYPIYGLTEPDGKATGKLDEFNGHETPSLGYHYHSTKTYPYLNGGFHGEVTERGGQVDPQPRAQSPRPATKPLRGAKITDFKVVESGSYSLTYTLDGETLKVNYTVNKDGSVKFDFVDGKGQVTSETYSGRPPRGGGGQGQGGNGGGQGRGQGGGQVGGQGGGGGEKPLGPPPGPRKPWLVDHYKELDGDKNNEVSLKEVTDQCSQAFKEYAGTADSIDTKELPNKPTVRLAIGGFIKVHFKELDKNSDGKITEKEIIDSMSGMFKKQDKNGDGKLSGAELEG